MFSCIEEINHASREELVEYLESRAIQCYDDEETEDLREAALEDFPIYEEEMGIL